MAGKMYGVDVASYQGYYDIVNTNVSGRKADFVIAKATEGTSYVNPYCDWVIQKAIKAGKPWGTYHYVNGTGAKAEVDFWLSQTWSGYGKKGIYCIDWEQGGNRAWGNMAYLKEMADYFYQKTGVRPLIYVMASAVNQVASSGILKDCGLWLAGYPLNNGSWNVPNFIYSVPAGSNMVMWQFDSGAGFDKNECYIDASTWAKYANPAGGGSAPAPQPSKPAQPSTGWSPGSKTLEQMADDTMNGKVGNGDARTKALGKYATGVQAIINHRSKVITGPQADGVLAKEVLAGKYGDGDERKRLLGSYYPGTQKIINGETARYYTVVSGDTLSGIGSKLGVNWQTLAANNGIGAPYNIFPGQKLKY